MTNQEIIAKVEEWQNAGFVHPLTCGNNSLHENLVAKEIEEKVILVCPDCDYIQNWIPEYVLNNYVQSVSRALQKNKTAP